MPRRLSHLAAATAAALVLSLAWGTAVGQAEGPLYVLPPSNLSPGQEAVEFTTHLNSRLPHLPAELNPVVAESTEEVEARIGALEQGVVLGGGARNAGAAAGSETQPEPPSTPADDPAPLSAVFVGAAVLALLGLLLGVARGRRPLSSG